MKEATSRLNLAKGTQNNHASYSNWEDSVMDYALWCSTYANKAQSENEYFQILNSLGYAEDGTYELKLKEVIQKYDLKNKFS
jgi:flagellum-specific peptidoglycan hydrolase FlgJ